MTSNIMRESCLCGTIEFKVSGLFESFIFCHCQRCQKDTGSAHAANLFSREAELHWIQGKDEVSTYQLPGSFHVKSFCKWCGSGVPTFQKELNLLVVPAGCVDGSIAVEPTAHIFCASESGWEKSLKDVPRFEGLPLSAGLKSQKS